ncbi:hypothetical protein ACFL1G_07320 [Planctomycetota bacterium]
MIFAKRTKEILLIMLFLASVANGYDYDANDFAAYVVDYRAGEGNVIYIYPETALGRPSIDTNYLGADRPVVPVYPQWQPDEIVTVGPEGYLILKFNHKIADDENNPYGIDFIVFGNAFQFVDIYNDWTYSDPCEVVIQTASINTEPARISVSQDGVSWYAFEEGPFGDSFAPTLGRVFDTNDPYTGYPGWDNQWWGEATNPTVPLDPNLNPEDFAGVSVAEMCQAYGKSAGGTGFDINDLDPCDLSELAVDANTGRRWIQYIKIECIAAEPADANLPEIDAVSDVSCCGDYKHPFPAGDIDKNCRVDYEDLRLFCIYWLDEVTKSGESAAAADVYEDNFIDFRDWAVLAENFSKCSWECNE